MSQKVLFIDRDGTLINEPADNFQVDRPEKLALESDVIPALLALQRAGFELVMITNQDGLGSDSFPQADFDGPQNLLMQIFSSQGIVFNQVLICPHLAEDHCFCRKPQTGLLAPWLKNGVMDNANSYVIGDREIDMQLAANMNINGLHYGQNGIDWRSICQQLIAGDRHAMVERQTSETSIRAEVWLNRPGNSEIDTGIGFFDHMLLQIATHGDFRLHLKATGDLHIDDHHTVEDSALALGEVLRKALGDKRGIARYGFVLPMDECLARCALDISGRPWLEFKAHFTHQYIGDLSAEMVEHFFRSLAFAMMSTLHLKSKGKNDHHLAESLFKAFGRTLRQAIAVDGDRLPSSKGVL